MVKTPNSGDRISGFPDEILHQILSFVPMKTAARTCVLSRRWKHIWNSYPVFEFNESSFASAVLDGINLTDATPQCTALWTTLLNKFTDVVDRRLHKFCESKFGIQTFDLSITILEPKFASMVEEWIGLAAKNNVKEFHLKINNGNCTLHCFSLPQTIFSAKSLTVLDLFGCGFNPPIAKNAINFQHLHSLFLENVYLDDSTIQQLTSSGRNMEILHLINCKGFKRLEISGLVKLINLTVKTLYWSDLSWIDCSGCRSLERVYVDGRVSLNCVFEDRDFPYLKYLSFFNCIFVDGIKISSHRLESLMLDECERIEGKSVIFAPKLSSMFYICGAKPSFLRLKLNPPCQLELQLNLRSRDRLLTPWFVQLKEFLHMQNQTKILDLFLFTEKNKFDSEEASRSSLLQPYALESLVLHIHSGKLNFAAIMDGLLWSCHPQILSVAVNNRFELCFLEFLGQTLMDRNYCRDGKMKRWQHSLKDVTIMRCDEDEDGVGIPLGRYSLRDAITNLGGRKTVSFKLKW
ncbi:hypothetical protein SLA2020_290540 [Shorea laevis]